MKELYAEIEIEASPEQVWQLLTDFSRLPEWNPFMQQARGKLVLGEKIEVQLQPPGGPGATIKPTLLKVEPNRELRWLGHLVIPGLFDGEHIFTIEPLDEARVKFVQREEFTGILASLMLRLIGENTRRGFEQMNQALKATVEQQNQAGQAD
jgi:hypothetical protein